MRPGLRCSPKTTRTCAQTVEAFARDEVAPVIGDLYEKGEFPYEHRPQDGRDGPVRPALPRGARRHGRRLLRAVPRLEELARVDSCVAITLEAAVSLGAMPLHRFGTAEQKGEWLPQLAAGSCSARSA